MNPHHPKVSERAGHRCEYCLAPESILNFEFEVEHIVPKAANGPSELDNFALACRACNLFKSAATLGEDGRTRLFNPRTDNWDSHFEFDPDTAEIRGITPIGRATVVALRLNRHRQIAARKQWIHSGLFP